MSALLEAVRLSVRYPNARTLAVRGVSLALDEKQTVALIGESGSGKSTLARALLGLLPATEGSVRFEGTPLAESLRFRAAVQPVFQDPSGAFNPRLTIGASLSEPLEVHQRLSKVERPARIAALIESVGLPASVRERLPRELSSGQRQRLAIARALALDPRLLILDEPVSALDVSVQAQILELLQSLRRARGLAWLFITHDLAVASLMAERVVVLYAGQVVEQGPVSEVLSRPRHPFTRGLVDASTPGTVPSLREATTRLGLTGCPLAPRCPHAVASCARESPHLGPEGADHQWACPVV